jgi:hypothetical protein
VVVYLMLDLVLAVVVIVVVNMSLVCDWVLRY